MHAVRVIAAMIVGGYASILSANIIADAIRAQYPADAGSGGFVFGPLTVGAAAAIVLLLAYRRSPA